jgi:hypothetical protein
MLSRLMLRADIDILLLENELTHESQPISRPATRERRLSLTREKSSTSRFLGFVTRGKASNARGAALAHREAFLKRPTDSLHAGIGEVLHE